MKCATCHGAGWLKATAPDVITFCRPCFGSGLVYAAPRMRPVSRFARVVSAVRAWL